MNTIFDHYYTEEFNDAGLLTKFEIDVPAEFDYAFDVCDVLAEKCPDELAMLWCNPEGERHEFTFADIKYWSDKTAAAMQEIGIGVGDRVLLILRRHYQFWFTFIACLKIGAVCIPATFLLKEHDLEYRINKANVKAVVCTQLGDIADVVDAGANKCPFLEYKLLVNGGFGGLLSKDTHQAEVPGPDEICTLPAEREGWIDFNQKILNASQDFNAYINAVHDPMLMYFTSGTSSNPKLVVHDHSYALAHTITARHWHMVQPRGLHFTIADTGWGKAVWGKLFGQWLNECAIFVYDFDRFNEAEILEQIQANKITSFCAPPTMYRMLKTHGIDNYDLSSIQHFTTAGEALNPDLFEYFLEKTGHKIHEGYGQTETPLTIANFVGVEPKNSSMGKPHPLYHIELIDDDGQICSIGQTGEVCIDLSTNPPGIIREYLGDDAGTTNAKRDGWCHTGDTAWKDEDGYFWYVGRNDDVIKSSGYRIGPTEIESVLLMHDAVCECAVTAVPDELRGSAVKATIVLTDAFSPSDSLTKELQMWVKNKTAPYKFPRIIDYVDSLPKTTNGKIMRKVIFDRDNK